MQDLSDDKPPIVILSPDYDSSNPDHVRRWELAGRPSLTDLDASGQHWRLTIPGDLQSDGSYLPRTLPMPAPVTDVGRTFLRVQAKLNADEEKRTGKPVNPDGAVPLSRAIAATAIIYNGWHYPSIEDLETEFNQFLLSKIYADPATNTTAESSTEQKQSALHFTLVMLAGQAFGVDYQAELGAYERTASQDFQLKLKDDDRDWLKLPCPKMHKDWPAFDTIKAMFQAVME